MSSRLNCLTARPGRVVDQVAAGGDVAEILAVGLGVHGDHHVHAARAADVGVLAHADLVPGRQPLDVGREVVLARHGDAHAEERLHQQRVGAGGPGAVDVGDLDGEVVVCGVSCDAHACGGQVPGFAARCDRARRVSAGPPRRWRTGSVRVNFCMSQAPVGQRSAHRPQCTQRSSSFTITRRGLRQRVGHVEILGQVQRRRGQPGAQVLFRAVRRDGQAAGRADVHAGIALDAELLGEHRLDVAVEAALDLLRELLGREAELHLDVQLLEALR